MGVIWGELVGFVCVFFLFVIYMMVVGVEMGGGDDKVVGGGDDKVVGGGVLYLVLFVNFVVLYVVFEMSGFCFLLVFFMFLL